MGEEEASCGVVGIGVGVCPFVMAAMVPSPFDDVVLNQALKHSSSDGERKFRWLLLRAVPATGSR